MRTEMYRYDDSNEVVVLTIYYVLRRTPKGMWVVPWAYDEGSSVAPWVERNKRFVLNEGTKRFCWETRELALKSLLARKQRQHSILSRQLSNVVEAIHVAQLALKERKFAEIMQLELGGRLQCASAKFDL